MLRSSRTVNRVRRRRRTQQRKCSRRRRLDQCVRRQLQRLRMGGIVVAKFVNGSIRLRLPSTPPVVYVHDTSAHSTSLTFPPRARTTHNGVDDSFSTRTARRVGREVMILQYANSTRHARELDSNAWQGRACKVPIVVLDLSSSRRRNMSANEYGSERRAGEQNMGQSYLGDSRADDGAVHAFGLGKVCGRSIRNEKRTESGSQSSRSTQYWPGNTEQAEGFERTSGYMNCVDHEPVVRAVHELVSLTFICNVESRLPRGEDGLTEDRWA
ncbi:hypothetical protein AB1N83_006842 [Pleurotus pulmonarius]